MKTRVVIKSWNDLPIPNGYTKEEYERYTKAGWEILLRTLLSLNNPNHDKFEIENVEVWDQ